MGLPENTPAALGGLRIADFSRVLAGPLSTMVLADLGAEVVKVERPGSGDDTRSWGPPHDDTGTSTYFDAVNRNKTSLTLDLGTPEGVAAARELVASADVVVQNFRPGVMERLGLGWAELSADRPDLVYCSISAFGSGAGATLPGYDLIVQAVGGLMSITGEPDGDPQKVGVALIDVVAGLYATVGVLAALRHRDATGEGQLVEVDLLSALLGAMANQSTAYTAAGVVARRMGNDHPSVAPYELLPAADGRFAVAVGNDRLFGVFCAALGRPELAADPRYATNLERVAHRELLRLELVGVLRATPAAEWVSRLQAAGVPAGPVNDIAGAFALADSLGLEPVVQVPRADGTTLALPRNPIRMSRTPATYRTAPPPLGGAAAPGPTTPGPAVPGAGR